MGHFIEDVINDIQNQDINFDEITFVLPSKRAGLFVLKAISKLSESTGFAPVILSIEEFIAELSQLHQVANSELLFRFYSSYLSSEGIKDHDDFETFMGWGQTLLNDFNEIDRYLVDPDKVLNYISAIKDLDHWSMQHEQTPLMRDYTAFWKSLYSLYETLNTDLLDDQMGYQGMLYREAVNNLENYIQNHSDRHHVFMGFNALNNAESVIIQELLINEMAEIYWDIDDHFLSHKKHSAGYFIRLIKDQWRYYDQHPFKWTHDLYKQDKDIQFIGTSSQIGQAKYVGELVAQLEEEKNRLDNTAVLLGEEGLLIPVLSGLGESLNDINVTMGISLSNFPFTSLLDSWFKLQLSGSRYYYSTVLELLNHPLIYMLFESDIGNISKSVSDEIRKRNLTFLKLKDMQSLAGESHSELIDLLFSPWNNNPLFSLKAIHQLVFRIKNRLTDNKESNKITLEYLFRYHELLNSVENLIEQFPHLTTVTALFQLFKHLRQNENLDFQGEPLAGLQVMGILESRVLDFDTVIITSVNESILPAGQSYNSFIPSDVKREFGLPSFHEKDAIYAYHFFRLIQRAKKIFLLYNSETDALNTGEKSRFLTMMKLEDIHDPKEIVIRPHIPKIESDPGIIEKTDDMLALIREKFKAGVSPSALLQYIRNPFDFYKNYVLGVHDIEQVEEVVAANTLGTVIHETLREIYTPFKNKFLASEKLKASKSSIENIIRRHFKKFFREGDLSRGKNLIVFEIAKQYVVRFIDSEIDSINKGNRIKILGIEENVIWEMNATEIGFPVKLKGQIDRVDEFNGVMRVIDYKTGKVEAKDVHLIEWSDLTTDYKKYSKSFQVLMYAYILNGNSGINFPCEAGIISFKNLNSGFLKFTKKDKAGIGAMKDVEIQAETLKQFESQLIGLMKEILNPQNHIIEKPV
ncbi:MAG: PD-(D/E)XK nuclease family protein [Flavobacteriaceae bacterium]|nr:PD-(D/E)XK nuclease family protein [Flavobacteriaceae bacterium]